MSIRQKCVLILVLLSSFVKINTQLFAHKCEINEKSPGVSFDGGPIQRIPIASSFDGLLLDRLLPDPDHPDIKHISFRSDYLWKLPLDMRIRREVVEDYNKDEGERRHPEVMILPQYPIFYITIPEKDSYPAIVMPSGTGGISSFEYAYAEFFRSIGIATLIFSVNPKVISDSSSSGGGLDQLTSPLEEDIVTAFKALQMLRTDPKVTQVGIFGASRGGIVAEMTARTFYQKHLSPEGQAFDFHLVNSHMPIFFEEEPQFTGAPILFMHGIDDDYTPLALVEFYYAHIRRVIGDRFRCDLIRYPGGHMFDAPDDVGFFSKALMFLRLYPTTREVQLLGNCCVMDGGEKGFIPLNIDGTFDSDFVSWDVYERFMYERVRIGGVPSLLNKDSAAMAKRDIVEFLTRNRIMNPRAAVGAPAAAAADLPAADGRL